MVATTAQESVLSTEVHGPDSLSFSFGYSLGKRTPEGLPLTDIKDKSQLLDLFPDAGDNWLESLGIGAGIGDREIVRAMQLRGEHHPIISRDLHGNMRLITFRHNNQAEEEVEGSKSISVEVSELRPEEAILLQAQGFVDIHRNLSSLQSAVGATEKNMRAINSSIITMDRAIKSGSLSDDDRLRHAEQLIQLQIALDEGAATVAAEREAMHQSIDTVKMFTAAYRDGVAMTGDEAMSIALKLQKLRGVGSEEALQDDDSSGGELAMGEPYLSLASRSFESSLPIATMRFAHHDLQNFFTIVDSKAYSLSMLVKRFNSSPQELINRYLSMFQTTGRLGDLDVDVTAPERKLKTMFARLNGPLVSVQGLFDESVAETLQSFTRDLVVSLVSKMREHLADDVAEVDGQMRGSEALTDCNVALNVNDFMRLASEAVHNAIKYRDPAKKLEVALDLLDGGGIVLPHSAVEVVSRGEKDPAVLGKSGLSGNLEGYAVVVISDNGVGIKSEDLVHAVSPGGRVHERKHEIKGAGDGFSGMLHIVRNHRGRLFIDTTPGVGTSLVVALPKVS